MIHVLETLVALEATAVLLMVSRVPRVANATVRCIGMLKTRRKMVMVLLIFLGCTSMVRIQRSDPSHQRVHVVEAYLLGFSYLLALILHAVHTVVFENEYIRDTMRRLGNQLKKVEEEEKQRLRKEVTMNALEKSVGVLRLQLEQMNISCKNKDDEIMDLRVKLERMKLDAEGKEKELRSADASVVALKKQAEGFLLEYDRLLEDNGNLRGQLSAFDRRYSGSDSKKRS